MSLLAVVMMAALVLVERKRSKSNANKGGTALVMIGSAFSCALYGYDLARTMITVIAELFGFGTQLAEKIGSEQGSRTGMVIKSVILCLLIVPMAAGALYILIRLIRSTLENAAYAAALAIIAAVVMLVGGVASLLLTVPYWRELITTLMIVFNPVVLLFLMIFTCGLALPFLAVMVLVENVWFISIMTFGGIFAVILLVWSAAMGISAAVCAYRSGKVKLHEAVVCGGVSALPIWNIVPMIYLKKKLRE